MKWLVTFAPGVDLESANALLTAHGAKAISPADITPMENAEWVAAIDGPDDLSASLRNSALVRGVYPNSEMTYYDRS